MPGKFVQRPQELGLGGRRRLVGGRLQIDLEFALMGPVRVARGGQFGAPDALRDRTHDRQLGEYRGHPRSHPQRLLDRGARHRRHMDDEMPFLELGKKRLPEERQQREAARGQHGRAAESSAAAPL